MKKATFLSLTILFLLLTIYSSKADILQTIKITGIVINEDGLPIKDAKVSVAESSFYVTDAEGNFNYNSTKKLKMPFKVTVTKLGYQMKTFSITDSGTELEIILEKTGGQKSKEITIRFYDEKQSPITNTKISIDGSKFVSDTKGVIKTSNPFLEKSIVLIEGYDLYEINYNESKIIFEVTAIKKTMATISKNENVIPNKDKNASPFDSVSATNLKQKITYEQYKGGIEEVTMQIKAEQLRVEGNNKKIRDEIIAITDRLKTEKNLSPEQRKDLKSQVDRMEAIVLENTLAFQKSQERTNFLILNLKNIISEKDSNYSNALKKIAVVEKENRITARKFKRNLIIFSIITIALLILAIVFYSIAVKMRKQRKALLKTNKEMLGIKELLEIKINEMNAKNELIAEQNKLLGKG